MEETILTAQNLKFRYDSDQPVYALDGVSTEVKRGEFVAVLGANGCGKSTLAKHFNAILLPESGKVYVENGRTYVPLRLVCNLLGGSAVWDPYLGGAAVTSAGAAHDAADFYWLSRIISAESGGECLEGQIAVGNVVLNRVASREFPDTIPGVIFDRVDGVQFEPVSNGTVYKAPTAQATEAARRVLAGENVIGDALYFYAPALSQGLWINANRTYCKTIGCHRFYL